MAVDLQALLKVVTITFILQYVNLLPIDGNSKRLRTSENTILSYKNGGVFLVRIKKQAVKVGTCPRGRQWYKGKCRTQAEYNRLLDNDGDYGGTEVSVYEVVALTNKENVEDDVPVTTETSMETNIVTLFDATNTNDFPSTEATININTLEVDKLSPTVTSDDHSDVESERMKNVTYTVLMVISGAVVLTWLLKLLYDYYLRREEDSARCACSTDAISDFTSRDKLCSS